MRFNHDFLTLSDQSAVESRRQAQSLDKTLSRVHNIPYSLFLLYFFISSEVDKMSLHSPTRIFKASYRFRIALFSLQNRQQLQIESNH